LRSDLRALFSHSLSWASSSVSVLTDLGFLFSPLSAHPCQSDYRR
jgi:hypothetical protein